MNKLRWAAPAIAFAVFAGAWAGGVRVNYTVSAPLGLWREGRAVTVPQRGQMAMVCLPPNLASWVLERGYVGAGDCSGGHEPLLKPVAAVPGDTVEVSADGVDVNGVRVVPGAVARDGQGRALTPYPAGRYTVPAGEVWLLSNHDRMSLDSRYMGPLPISALRGEAHPLLVLP